MDDFVPSVCEDINECEVDNTIDCGYGVCVNIDGGYYCDCDDGFEELVTTDCRNVDMGLDNEMPHETCSTSKTCIDTDECALGTDNCPSGLGYDSWVDCCTRK